MEHLIGRDPIPYLTPVNRLPFIFLLLHCILFCLPLQCLYLCMFLYLRENFLAQKQTGTVSI